MEKIESGVILIFFIAATRLSQSYQTNQAQIQPPKTGCGVMSLIIIQMIGLVQNLLCNNNTDRASETKSHAGLRLHENLFKKSSMNSWSFITCL